MIKDLGDFSIIENNEDFSHIEIPNIKIPKIEIPKIEIPAINFSKLVTKTHKPISDVEDDKNMVKADDEKEKSSEVSVKQVENSDGIIDSLFSQQEDGIVSFEDGKEKSEHIVDPEDYALYKKYLA